MKSGNTGTNVTDTNEQIIARCQRGDLAAFRELVEANQAYGYAIAYRLLGDKEESRDVVQESMIRIWKHIGQLDAGRKFSTWYYRIVVNLCYDHLKWKKRQRRKINDLRDLTVTEENSPVNPEILLEKKEWAEAVRQGADGLPLKQKTVFVLRDLQGLSIEEVRQVTGLTAGAVKSNLYYARKALHKKLEKPE